MPAQHVIPLVPNVLEEILPMTVSFALLENSLHHSLQPHVEAVTVHVKHVWELLLRIV